MSGFHKRYMVSNKVCRLWANMVRQMDIEMMVPQHGRYFVGKEAIHAFLDWIENLQCGIDLFTQGKLPLPWLISQLSAVSLPHSREAMR
jgi:flavorubredoxin